MRPLAWIPTDGVERPPPDAVRCAVAWTDEEGNKRFDLSVYLDGSDMWDDSIETDEYKYKPFTAYSHFIPLPELS